METIVTDNHHLTSLVPNLLLFFGVAGLTVPLLQQLRLSPVLAYLFLGIVIGPYGLGQLSTNYAWLTYVTITDLETVQVLGELGIITLMFMIGLELSLSRLVTLKKYIFGLGSAQIIVTATLIFLIARQLDASVESSIILGAALALSSTAIVMKLLEDKGKLNRPIGSLCFSVLLMQDMAVVPILVLISSFSGSASDNVPLSLFTSIMIGLAAVMLILSFGRKILTPLINSVSKTRNPEWLIAFTVFFTMVCSAITEAVGSSLALGAFLAGLLVAETALRHEIEVTLNPLKGMLLGIFFLSVGMKVNIMTVLSQPFLIALLVVGIFILKASVILLLCRLFKLPQKHATQAAIYLSQPGEFALVILGGALTTRFMSEDTIELFLIVVSIAMILTPIVFNMAPKLYRVFYDEKGDQMEHLDMTQYEKPLVIIAGFGRVGQLLGRALVEEKIDYVGIDSRVDHVLNMRREGYNVVVGDARNIKLWQRLNPEDFLAAVIAIDDYEATHNIVNSIRSEWPVLPIIARTKDTIDLNILYAKGVRHIVAETLETSLSIARLLLQQLGVEEIVIEQHIAKLREH